MNKPALTLPCPTCKKPVQMTGEFPFRPFCSARCQAIDFGEWAGENHRIAGGTVDPDAWLDDVDEQGD